MNHDIGTGQEHLSKVGIFKCVNKTIVEKSGEQ